MTKKLKENLTGLEIRKAVGAGNLKTLKQEYKVLRLVNTLYGHISETDANDCEITATDVATLVSDLRDLLEMIANDYDMVPRQRINDPKHASSYFTFKGEHDEWVAKDKDAS